MSKTIPLKFHNFYFIFVYMLILPLLAGCGHTTKQKNTQSASAAQIAEAAHLSGDYSLAADLYNKAIKNDPNNIPLLMGLGKVQLDARDYDAALETFKTASKIDDQSSTVRRGMAKAYLSTGLIEEALKQYLVAKELEPNNINTLIGIGVVKDLEGKHKDAQASYVEALALDPMDVAAKNNLALSYALDGSYEQAIEILRKLSLGLASSEQQKLRHRQNLALAYGLSGDFQKAEDILKMDMDSDSAKQNVAYYQSIRHLTSKERASLFFGGANTTANVETTDSKSFSSSTDDCMTDGEDSIVYDLPNDDAPKSLVTKESVAP